MPLGRWKNDDRWDSECGKHNGIGSGNLTSPDCDH